jgi:hypothetical protein
MKKFTLNRQEIRKGIDGFHAAVPTLFTYSEEELDRQTDAFIQYLEGLDERLSDAYMSIPNSSKKLIIEFDNPMYGFDNPIARLFLFGMYGKTTTSGGLKPTSISWSKFSVQTDDGASYGDSFNKTLRKFAKLSTFNDQDMLEVCDTYRKSLSKSFSCNENIQLQNVSANDVFFVIDVNVFGLQSMINQNLYLQFKKSEENQYLLSFAGLSKSSSLSDDYSMHHHFYGEYLMNDATKVITSSDSIYIQNISTILNWLN